MRKLNELLENLETELKFSGLQKDIVKNQEVFVDNMGALVPFLKKKAFFIVVGRWEGCELFDRPAAYKIAEEIKKLKVKKDPIVIIDEYFNAVKNIYNENPLILIGGPVSNMFTSELAEKTNMKGDVNYVGIIPDYDGRTVAYIWGPHARSTLEAAEIFLKSYLKDFAKYL